MPGTFWLVVVISCIKKKQELEGGRVEAWVGSQQQSCSGDGLEDASTSQR